ncbi:PIN domain-containing protein [Streptomyces durmitorensis]|uniref:Ribonuclease VapC n=1 Tax=Streptomyces durmitorensis TaxID=319947 RepID=A0ABY4Q7F8_9ACTN|nr:PIN domain-containing protein [Streptomyces durmitorensis]UQT61640.1 PIN domain-containing protein [Streptomyces durmitorensis]
MSRYLLDSSALWRILRDDALAAKWREAAADGDIRSCYPQRAEFLMSARNCKQYEAYRALLSDLYADGSVPKGAAKWIGAVQLRAAEKGAHKALSAVGLQICATAAHHGLIVLHDDNDFVTAERFAVEMRQRNVREGPLGDR